MRDSILIRLVSITRADQRFQDKNRVRFRRASVTQRHKSVRGLLTARRDKPRQASICFPAASKNTQRM